MSVRYEFAEASMIAPEYAPPGTDINGDVVKDGALVLNYGEVFVIAGSPEDFQELLHRVLAVVPVPGEVSEA